MEHAQGSERSVTLIIPTVHFRSAFFGRVLRYIAGSGIECPIIVSDHSPREHSGVIAGIVERHRNLDLKLLQHAPDLHFLNRLSLCATVAETPLVHLHADDDFLVRPTLKLLIRDMQSQPHLAAAMGLNVNVTFETGELTLLSKTSISHALPFERLIAQLETYSSALYALRRREEFIDSLSFAVQQCPDVQFWQYLESCLAVLKGPVAVRGDLHYVREVHAGKWSSTLARERSYDHFPQLVLSPDFSAKVVAFRAAVILACERVRAPCAEDAIDNGIVHLLHRGLAAMGLPDKKCPVEERAGDALARLSSRFSDQSDPVTIELNRIFGSPVS